MSAPDPRVVALIQADIDGELDAEGRAELERALADSPPARTMHAELRRMTEALGRMAQAEPPADLRAHLADWTRRASPSPRLRPVAQAGLALAACLALAAIGVGLWREGRHPIDPSSVAGTLASPDAVTTVRVDNEAVRGSVGLQRRDGRVVLDFDLDASSPVQVVALFEPSSIRLDPAAAPALDGLQATAGRVAFTTHGRRHVALPLRAEPDAAGAIRIEFRRSGALLHAASLDLPGGHDDG